MQVSKVSTYVIISAYCACTSYELLTKWRIISLTKHLRKQVHFTFKSACACVSARHRVNTPQFIAPYK